MLLTELLKPFIDGLLHVKQPGIQATQYLTLLIGQFPAMVKLIAAINSFSFLVQKKSPGEMVDTTSRRLNFPIKKASMSSTDYSGDQLFQIS